MSDDGDQTASIACEACRRKKCKCDRKLPSCTQCRSSPDGCLYPEKNRRGIPAGYVNALERRLAETERALFFALQELHGGAAVQAEYESQSLYPLLGQSALSNDTPSTQQEKADLVASWASRPLENRNQARAWLETMRTGAFANDGVHQPPSAAPVMVPGSRPLLGIQSEGDRVRDNGPKGSLSPEQQQQSSFRASRQKGKRSRGRATGVSELHHSYKDGVGADPVIIAPEPSRASSFANANRKIYF